MVSFSPFLIPYFLLALSLIFLYKWQQRPTKNLPPSPRKFPVIGNLHQVGPLPHRSFQSMSQKHGPIMLLHFGNVPVLVVSSADAAREIMKNQDLIFSNRPKLTIPDKIFYGSKDVVFAPYGEYWRKIRSICVNHFLSMKKVQSYRRVREEETSLMIENIAKSSADKSVTNLSEILALLTSDIWCRLALGRKYSDREEGKDFDMILRDEVEVLATFCVGDYIPWLAWIDRVTGLYAKVESLAQRLDEFLEGVVKEHRCKNINGEREEIDHNDTNTDFVDKLLQIQTENEDGGSPIDNDVIKSLIINMFNDGIDTTYIVIEWTMAELLKNPNAMEKLQSEVRQIAGGKEDITEDDLDKMHYLKAVIKESMRLHSPVPLLATREATKDTKVMGYDVAAGTQVLINVWAIGRDQSLWNNPEDFDPDRFMNKDIDYKGLNFELIPFGAGRRGCPGITYAMVINELAIAKLVHKFDFELPDGARKEDLDVSEKMGMNSHIKLPVLVVATPCIC